MLVVPHLGNKSDKGECCNLLPDLLQTCWKRIQLPVDNIVFLNNLPKTFSKTVHTTRVIPREPVKNTRDVVAVVLHFDDDEMSRLL